MKKYNRSHKGTRVKKTVFVFLAVFIFAGLIIFILEKTNTTSLFSDKSADISGGAQTTSDVPSAQSDFTGGDSAEENKDPGNTISENSGSATITDTSGTTSSNTSEPKTSSTGEITVYLPLKDAALSPGQEISGTSSLSTVNYRLIDSVSGVIATGTLGVIDGKFSGTISFNTSAREGRLDIFGAKSDASEFSTVEIPVRFE